MQRTTSRLLKHSHCEHCGSSDGNAIYDDNHQWCFVCNTFIFGDGDALQRNGTENVLPKLRVPMKTYGTVKSIPERGITLSTCETYGVTQEEGKHYYPYADDSGQTVAVKKRDVASKTFSIAGDFTKATLFGQHLFGKGGKYITLVEGELDALAAYQMMGSKWPVVSIRNGAQAALKDVKQSFEWLDSFESIVICFDSDEPGVKAAAQVAELFGAKAKVMKHQKGYKDACDYLAVGADKRFVDSWWRADSYKPDGIVTVADIEEELLTPPAEGEPWCFPTLTKLTYGRRPGELYAFGAGVGIGKTDVFTQQIAYDIEVLNQTVGVIYLEQPVTETAQRVLGKLDKKLYHIPDAGWDKDEYIEGIRGLKESNKLIMYRHFGAKDWATVKSRITYIVKVYDAKKIYLDHLTALAANEQDERRALDGIMADMATLAQSLNITIHFISHLTTPEGKAHEEGGRVLEKHFTGSRAIARWSHYMFGLERDKQAEDKQVRQTTTFRVLKDRFTGRATGEKFGLFYDQQTGILNECELDYEEPL